MWVRVIKTIIIGGIFFLAGCAAPKQLQTAHVLPPPPPPSNLSSFEQGMVAWKTGNHDQAAALLKGAYANNDPEAEAMLGVLYVKGAGVFRSPEVGRAYAISADQRKDFDAYSFYLAQWQQAPDADRAYLIAWVLANRFSGRARADYENWITTAASLGHIQAQREVNLYLN